MKKLVLIYFFVLIKYSLFSQEIDSLKILKNNDWMTLSWFEKDTVYLMSRPKVDTIYDGLTLKQKWKKIKWNTYGERISFETGKVKYSLSLYCPVGEKMKKINAFELRKDKVFIDFQSKKWPWKNNEWIYRKEIYSILEWSKNRIILKKL